ncbi:MAG: hypothetical protein ACK41C_12625 [Phenylobacterium sp.]|uniref:hypothetical protein n=1 Tax=Phenylobacterium sp. TaxID=1871053 RepID=UPI003918F1F2
MQTLTDLVAAVVVHSSAAAYAHFGLPMEAQQVKEPVPAERTVARSAPAAKASEVRPDARALKASKTPIALRPGECPDAKVRPVKA